MEFSVFFEMFLKTVFVCGIIIAHEVFFENGDFVKSHTLFVMRNLDMQGRIVEKFLYQWNRFIGNFDIEGIVLGRVEERLVWSSRKKFTGDPYFRFYFPLKGEFQLLYAAETVSIKPGRIWLIPPVAPFLFKGVEPSTHYWFHFFSRELRKIPDLLTPCSAEVGDPEKLEKEFLELIELVRTCRSLGEAEEIRHRCVRMMTPVIGNALNDAEYKTVREGQFSKVIDYIDRNLHRKIEVEELVRLVHLPRAKFSSEFSKAFGCPPKQYITSRRVDRAKHLLIRTDLSVKEIAQETGFSNEFFFSRIFRKYTASSPSGYRMKLDCGNLTFLKYY